MSVSYPDLPLTSFPESVDTFVEMLDIVASDATALKAYQTAMENGDINAANSALTSMTNGVRKILTADKINKIFESVEALQRFFSTDIIPYITQLQTNWQTEINKFIYRGAYSSSVAYTKNNIVSYTVGAYTFLFLCIKNTTAGIAPTNTTYWQQFTIVGLQGESGTGMSFLYEWNNQTSYNTQDCVSYNGKLWGCVTANSNSAPSSTNPKWEELMSITALKYPVQAEQPSVQEPGELWFQVVRTVS